MYLLLETIKCLDGVLYNLKWHNLRFNYSRKILWESNDELKLENLIQIPENCTQGLFRCRVIYSSEIEKIEFVPHMYRKIESVIFQTDNQIDYSFKFADRKRLQGLYDQRGIHDDFLIIRNGFITDSYTANPVFFDGRKWITPISVLLKGTQRARLLCEGQIHEKAIDLKDLVNYRKMGLINAMQDLDNMPVINIENLHWPSSDTGV